MSVEAGETLEDGSRIGEEIHESFFEEGDEGRYEGGPASLHAQLAAIEAEVEHPRELVRTPEQEARRTTFIRLVVRVVGCCVAVLVVAVTWAQLKARRSSDEPVREVPMVAPPAPVEPIAPKPAAAPELGSEAAPAAPAEPAPAEAAPAEPVPAPVAPAAPEPDPASELKPPAFARESPAPGRGTAPVAPRPRPPAPTGARPAPLPKAPPPEAPVAPAPPKPAAPPGVAPPTAAFPID